MLTVSSFWWLLFGLKTSNSIGSTPYFWNEKTKKVEFMDTWYRKLIWAVHNLIYAGYELYVLARWVNVAFILESPTTPRALGTLYVLLSYNFTLAIQYSVLRNYGQHHIWINIYLEYFDEFQRRHEVDLSKGRKTKVRGIRVADASKAMFMTTAIIFVIFVLDTASVFTWPAAPFFTSSMTSQPMSLTLSQIVPFACFHIYIWTHQWFTVFFYAYSVLCYLCGVKNTMNYLRIKAETRGLGAHRDNLEMTIGENDGPAFADEYRRLQVMQLYTNKLWSTTNILYEIIFILGAIFGFYGSVRLKGARALHQISVGIFFFSTLVHLWKNMSEVYETSVELLNGWKDMSKNKWFRHFLRSTRPARMNIGNFYFADREIILTIMQIVMNNTCTLVMSTSASRSKGN